MLEAYRDTVANLLAGKPVMRSLEVLRRLWEPSYGGARRRSTTWSNVRIPKENDQRSYAKKISVPN